MEKSVKESDCDGIENEKVKKTKTCLKNLQIIWTSDR